MDVAVDAAPKLSTLGKYSLIASLGQGGMAKVYLALMAGPAGFNKLLVIKALREDMLSTSEEFVHMFLDEARLAARLNHPNIVQTYEVGESDGRYFIAMEYLEGQSLRTVQRRLAPAGLPLEEELRVIAETARGLHYAHELKGFNGEPLGVVHRDVSPQNVFLTYDGGVKLLDFGIAKTQDAEHLTKVGVIKGKIDYIAPEQIRGDRIDRRADIFALGAMMWEAVTARRFAGGPKVADVTKIHTRVTGGEPKVRELKPDVPDLLGKIIDRAIALDPADRYATAAEFADDIERFLESVTLKPTSKTLTELIASPFEAERAKMRKLIDQQIQIVQKKGGVALGETTGGLPRIGGNQTRTASGVRLPDVDLTESGYLDLGGDSLPSLETSAQSVSTAHVAPAMPAKKGAPKAIVFALIAGAVAGGLFFAMRPEGDPPAQAAAPVVTTEPIVPKPTGAEEPGPVAPSTTPEPPVRTTIKITVDVWPTDAHVTLDEAQLPKIPFTAELQKDGVPHHIEASAEGYQTRKIMLPFDSDRDVKIVLEKAPPAPAGGGRSRRNYVQQAPQPAPQPAPDPAPTAHKKEDPEPGTPLPTKPRVRTGIDVADPYAN